METREQDTALQELHAVQQTEYEITIKDEFPQCNLEEVWGCPDQASSTGNHGIKQEPKEEFQLTNLDTETSSSYHSHDPHLKMGDSSVNNADGSEEDNKLFSRELATGSMTTGSMVPNDMPLISTRSFYKKSNDLEVLPIAPVNADDSDIDLDDDDDDVRDPDFILDDADDAPTERSRPPSKRQKLTREAVELDDADSEQHHDEVEEHTEWEHEDIAMYLPPNLPQRDEVVMKSCIEYFNVFFSDASLEQIIYETNLYAKQKDVNSKFTIHKEEMLQFIGIVLYMGIVSLPAMEDYWASSTRVPQVADVMSRDRFKAIRRHIHFNNNETGTVSTDRFFKVRPLIDNFRNSSRSIVETTVQSIDEVMIAYKGTGAGNLRQYINNKPNKWGFKFFARASSDGIVHDLLPYQGATTFGPHEIEMNNEEAEMNISSKVVISLCKSMKNVEGATIYADNFFTSYKLVLYLKEKLHCRYTGTARENRIGNVELRDTKEMSKKSTPRGDVDYKSCNGILALKWKDNKVVTVLSSGVGALPMTTISRYDRATKSKRNVPCPQVIKYYNSHMGGINKSDMLCHLYKTPMRARRWYIPIFGYILDLCICNAWLLYKRDAQLLSEDVQPLKEFRLKVARVMTQGMNSFPRAMRVSMSPAASLPSPKQGQKLPLPLAAIRYNTSISHLPRYSSVRLTCKHCSRQSCLHRTRWVGSACNVALCLTEKQNCFQDFHQ